MKMRRADREITDINKINEYLKTAPFMNLAINNENSFPYIVALNYGFEMIDNDIILYFHCAKQGRKINLLNENNLVGVQITSKSDLKRTEKAADYSTYYSSVYLEGVATLLEDKNDKIHGLNLLMKNVDFKGELSYPESVLNATYVYKIVCKNYSAKSSVEGDKA